MRKVITLLAIMFLFRVSFAQDSVKINKPRLIFATSAQASVFIGGIAAYSTMILTVWKHLSIEIKK